VNSQDEVQDNQNIEGETDGEDEDSDDPNERGYEGEDKVEGEGEVEGEFDISPVFCTADTSSTVRLVLSDIRKADLNIYIEC